jgi:ankyrin repeat protein
MNTLKLTLFTCVAIGLQAVNPHVQTGHTHIYLGEEKDKDLINAVENNNLEQTTQALSEGADINARRDGDRKTPLMIATKNGNKEIVQFLLSKNASIDFMDINKNKAASLATNPEIANIIRNAEYNRTLQKALKFGMGALALGAAAYYYWNK